MNMVRFVGSMAIASALAACATPDSRIRRHREEFESFPAEVQKKIRDGQADVGFTKAQAEMALGRPDRVYTRKTAAVTQDVWAYGGMAAVSVGFGFGMSEGPLSVGAFEGEPEVASDRLRLVFQDGKVLSVERLR